MKGSVQKNSGSKMKRAAPNQKILDSNAISLKNKRMIIRLWSLANRYQLFYRRYKETAEIQ